MFCSVYNNKYSVYQFTNPSYMYTNYSSWLLSYLLNNYVNSH